MKEFRTVLMNTVSRARRDKCVSMMHSGRSGSTVLGHLLHQNPSVFWDSEIFLRNRMPSITRPISNLLFRTPKLVIGARRQRTTRPIYGFEAKLSQIARIGLTLSQYVAMMDEMQFSHFILLRRRNHLRLIISDLVAKQNRVWHQPGKAPSRKGDDLKNSPSTIRIDVDAISGGALHCRERMPLLAHLQTVEEEYRRVMDLLRNKRLLELFYEDHIEQDPGAAYKSVCEFLDVGRKPVKVTLRKTNPWPVSAIVENFDEVKGALADTPYAWMLNE